MGYCILGTSCQVDTDFVPDDLGGHCDRLSEAFNPKATFVCCKQNPALFEEDYEDKLEAVVLEHNIGHPTADASVAGQFRQPLTYHDFAFPSYNQLYGIVFY